MDKTSLNNNSVHCLALTNILQLLKIICGRIVDSSRLYMFEGKFNNNWMCKKCSQVLIPDSYIKQQKIKNSIKALACNFLDFYTRKMASDSIHMKTLKNLRQRYAILKPDKENGVVLMKLTD